MVKLAHLQRKLKTLRGGVALDDRCRCPAPVVIIQQGEPASDVCPRCGRKEPGVLQLVEEVVTAKTL